jgi:8-oxo-dGTP pyrophosphatase MutT (NUDIX family)
MFLQSGVIPYRSRAGELEVLLISSSGGQHWILPKGWKTPWLTSAQSAAREAWAEAGVVGTIRMPAIGHYRVRKWSVGIQVELFWLQVVQEFADFPEVRVRRRQWMKWSEAIEQIHNQDLKQVLKALDYSRLL